MAWPMHLNHRRHDHVAYRWEQPPQVKEGQTAQVNAPRAQTLLERRAADCEQPDRSVEPARSPRPPTTSTVPSATTREQNVITHA